MITKTITSSVIKGIDVDNQGISAILAGDDILQLGGSSEAAASGCLKNNDASAATAAATAEDCNACTGRSMSELPVQIFGLAEGITIGLTGRIAAATALKSLLYDVYAYIKKKNKVHLEIADFADLVSENADHAVRQQLTAWQGLQIGTSLAWVMIDNDIAYTFSVGDAALALYREDKLYQITDPISKSEMLSQDFFLGYRSRDSRLVPANLNRMPLKKGDIILLLSSEFTRAINDDEIAEQLARTEAFAGISDHLCAAARGKGILNELAVLTVKILAIDEPTAPSFHQDKPVRRSRLNRTKG